MSRSFATIVLVAFVIGCGTPRIEFEVGDADRRRNEDADDTRELAPRPLVVRHQEAGTEINHAIVSDASRLIAPYHYQPAADERLAVYIDRLHSKKCGGAGLPRPNFTLIELPASGSSAHDLPETKLRAAESFVVRQGVAYQLRLEMKVAGGACDTLGISFDVRPTGPGT